MTEGISIIEKLKKFGNVFADPKLHDIPNTVHNSLSRLESAGADIVTIHASGGPAMMQAASECKVSSKILAVTVLTSLSDQETKAIYSLSAKDTVRKLVKEVLKSKLDGVVCLSLIHI